MDHLSHVYQPDSPFESAAVKDVTLTIDDGEFVSVIGHTGSGKSTLVQHFNALLMPTAGTVTVHGIDTRDKAQRRLLRQKVGLVFQYPEHQLFEETVLKDVSFGPANLGIPADEVRERAALALRQVGLGDETLWEQSPFALSGGQRRRVAVAGVLAMQPQTLILDEPAAGLDPRGREEILSLAKALHDGGRRTVLMVTHSMDDAALLSTRILVMKDGGVVYYDRPSVVFEQHQQLTGMGLGVPQTVALVARLRACGFDLPADVYDITALAQAIRDGLATRKGGAGL